MHTCGGDNFEIGHFHNFRTFVTFTLTMNQVIRYTTMYHSSTSTYNWIVFFWTDVQTLGTALLALRVNLKINEYCDITIFITLQHSNRYMCVEQRRGESWWGVTDPSSPVVTVNHKELAMVRQSWHV